MAAEPGPQVLAGVAVRQILAQQPLDRFRDQRRRAPIADGAGNGGVLTDCAPQTEVIGVDEPAFVLDLFPLDADVGHPMLTASVGAAGHIELELLIESRQALFELVDNPAREALGLGNRKFAKLCSGAGNRAAPKRRALYFEADRSELAYQFSSFVVGDVDQEQILRNRGAQAAAAKPLG